MDAYEVALQNIAFASEQGPVAEVLVDIQPTCVKRHRAGHRKDFESLWPVIVSSRDC
jgi:hypothetical protein